MDDAALVLRKLARSLRADCSGAVLSEALPAVLEAVGAAAGAAYVAEAETLTLCADAGLPRGTREAIASLSLQEPPWFIAQKAARAPGAAIALDVDEATSGRLPNSPREHAGWVQVVACAVRSEAEVQGVIVAFVPTKDPRAAAVLEVACELLAWHRARTDGIGRARPRATDAPNASIERPSVKLAAAKSGPSRSSTPSPRDSELELGAQRLSARLGRNPQTPSVVVGLLRELGHDETGAMSIVTYALSKGILERRGSGLASARRPLVLVVDDDPEARHIVERVLRQEDFDVMTAPDGRVALEIARRARPDFIVLDLVMPVMNGWQLLAELRADPELAKVPIAVASAASPKRQPPPDAVDVLQKPLDFYRLVTSIEVALRQEGNVRSVVVDC